MQHAVNTAQETLQSYQFSQMQRYFHKDGRPYIVWITLSDGRSIEIPQITLLPQSLLSIEELEMSFKVQVAHTEVKSSEPEKQAPDGKTAQEPERASFQVQFARRIMPGEGEEKQGAEAGTISVQIKFKAIPIPEGAARVLDALNLDIVEKQGTA
jgi:hypothetical protein